MYRQTAQPLPRLARLLAVTGVLITAVAGLSPAAAAAPGSSARPVEPGPAGAPVSPDLALSIAAAPCVLGGATAADTALANQVRSQMNGTRMGGA